MTHFSHDYEQGIKDEQERIIKLLRNKYLKLDENGQPLDIKTNEDLLYVFELIKGNKDV